MMFKWTAKWQGIIYFEKVLLPNEWTIKVDFNGEADDAYEEQIAFDRCRFIIEDCYQDSLFVDINDDTFMKLKDKMAGTIITLPDEPVDSAIAIATLSKFACVAEDRLSFSSMSISSRLSDSVELNITADILSEIPWLLDNPIKSLTGEAAWFMRSNAGITDMWIKSKNKHEVIRDMDDWAKHGLAWDPEQNIKRLEEIIEQPIPRPKFTKGWKPKIIDGGKK